MTPETFKSPGEYNLVIITYVEVLSENQEIIRSYESEESNILEKTLKIDPGNVDITQSGDHYHKTGNTFYFFTNLTYKFINTNVYTYKITIENTNFATAQNNVSFEDGKTGSTITTTDKTGNFEFKNNGTTYSAIILPYVSQFTLGTQLQNIKESNADSSMFRGKDAKYTIGRAFDGIGTDLYDYLVGDNGVFKTSSFNNFEKAFYNGFKFDLNVLTNGGKVINTSNYNDYFIYTFYKVEGKNMEKIGSTIEKDENGEYTDIDDIGQYDPSSDAWSFTAEKGEYKVVIEINPLYVSKALIDNTDGKDPIIKPIEFKFVLDDSINVYTHEQFQAVFADTNIGSSLKGNEQSLTQIGISLHNNIEARLRDDQYYDTTTPDNPFVGLAEDATKAGHTPISDNQDNVWKNRNHPYGSVYSRFATELNETYVINGNCFEIDGSNLPFVSIYAEGNLSNVTGYEIAQVHVALIHYIVTDDVNSNSTSKSNLHINDLKILGNTKKYNSEADGSTIEVMNRNSGGYLGIMASYGCDLVIKNSIIQNTTVGLNVNNDASLDATTTVIKNSFSNAIYCYDNDDISIKNCYFEDAGGAAIHVEDNESYERVDGSEPFYTKTVVDLDTATVINNYVSGDEGFFKSRSFEILITGMKAQFQAGAEKNHMSMIETITDQTTGLQYEKINLIMLAVPRGDNTQEDGPWNYREDGSKDYVSTGTYQGTTYNMMSLKFGGAQTLAMQKFAGYGMSLDSITTKMLMTPTEQYGIGGNDILPITVNPDNVLAGGLGTGYMLTGYNIPTFGNSIIVTGVKGVE